VSECAFFSPGATPEFPRVPEDRRPPSSSFPKPATTTTTREGEPAPGRRYRELNCCCSCCCCCCFCCCCQYRKRDARTFPSQKIADGVESEEARESVVPTIREPKSTSFFTRRWGTWSPFDSTNGRTGT